MKGLAAVARAIDRLNDWIGRVAAWLVLVTVVVCATTALLRYLADMGYIWMQELYVMAFGLTFMLVAAYAYLKNQHVRVDILYGRLTVRQKAWVEIFGILVFLLPWLATLAWAAHQFILSSWRILEPSSAPGGLPIVYLFKTAIWVFCALLALQAVSVLLRNVLILRGREDLI